LNGFTSVGLNGFTSVGLNGFTSEGLTGLPSTGLGREIDLTGLNGFVIFLQKTFYKRKKNKQSILTLSHSLDH
jgi:hypothetical protein